jgi:hypothetical protein
MLYLARIRPFCRSAGGLVSHLDAEIVHSLIRFSIYSFQEAYQFLLIQILTLDYLLGNFTKGMGGHIL